MVSCRAGPFNGPSDTSHDRHGRSKAKFSGIVSIAAGSSFAAFAAGDATARTKAERMEDTSESLSSEGKYRTRGLAHDMLGCRSKEHEIGCSSTLDPHHDQFSLTISGDPQNLPPWLAAWQHHVGLAVGRGTFWQRLFEELPRVLFALALKSGQGDVCLFNSDLPHELSWQHMHDSQAAIGFLCQ